MYAEGVERVVATENALEQDGSIAGDARDEPDDDRPSGSHEAARRRDRDRRLQLLEWTNKIYTFK